MKNNLISAIAGWKSAALLVLVAVVAAVAFSGILTSTQSADAAGPGDTAQITTSSDMDGTVTTFTADLPQNDNSEAGNDGIATFEITGGSASASFTANGGQTLVCANDTACDSAKDGKDDGTATGDAPKVLFPTGTVRVSLSIDEDSPNGFILIRITDANGGDGESPDLQRVNVSTADRVVSLKAAGPSAAPAVSAAGSVGVQITATLQNSVDGGVNGKGVIIYTTLGVLTGCGGAGGSIQACTEESAATDTDGDNATDLVDGTLQVTLLPTGRAGVATVNFTLGELTAAVDVVFFGPAVSIEAEAMQSSIAIGGDTYIVVTVTDAGDNPVVGYLLLNTRKVAALNGGDGVIGPAAKSKEVVAAIDRDFDANGNRAVDKGDLPACGDQTAAEYATAGEAGTGRTDLLVAAADDSVGAGTNSAGQCVIYVNAPSGAAPTANATRGTNTVNVAGPAADLSTDVAVEIQVGGPPSSISTDAPAYVEPLSSTKVTITVVDDEEVLVGAIPASVFQVEGSGKVIAGEGEVTTSDGTVSFTYLAPSSPGTAVFRVTAGTKGLADNVVVTIGAAPEEAPDAPPATWNDALVSGAQNVVWNGDDDAAVADGAAEGVTAIWQWNGTGWDGYFPAAADVPGGNTLETLTSGAAYWVIAD